MTIFPTQVPPFTYSTSPVKRTDLIDSDFSIAKTLTLQNVTKRRRRQKLIYDKKFGTIAVCVCVWDLHVSTLKRSNHVSYIT